MLAELNRELKEDEGLEFNISKTVILPNPITRVETVETSTIMFHKLKIKTRLTYIGLLGELEHLRIETRLIDEMVVSVMGEFVFLK